MKHQNTHCSTQSDSYPLSHLSFVVYQQGKDVIQESIANLIILSWCHPPLSFSDGKVYALGGMGSDTSPQALVRVYEPVKDQWLSLASMPTPRYGAFSFLRGNKLYVLGKPTHSLIQWWEVCPTIFDFNMCDSMHWQETNISEVVSWSLLFILIITICTYRNAFMNRDVQYCWYIY